MILQENQYVESLKKKGDLYDFSVNLLTIFNF